MQKLSASHEAVWSKNAGRGATGAMIGDIIARKTKLEITFSPSRMQTVFFWTPPSLPAFFSVVYKDPGTGKMETKTMYAGTPKYPVYTYAEGFPRYVGVAVNLIEK